MPHPDWHAALVLGLLLGAALLAGLAAEIVRLPKVTAYLLVGLLLGPTAVHLISHEDLTVLDPLGKLAIALVLFGIGCHFPLSHVRRILRRVLRLSVGELGFTFLLVSVGLFVVGSAMGNEYAWPAALLFAALALATAPATTILVLQESRSEGPVTEYTTALVVLNNLAAIVLFEVLFLLIAAVAGGLEIGPDETTAGVLGQQLLRLGIDLIGSVLAGAVAGVIVSLGCALIPGGYWLVLLVGMATTLLAACQLTGMSYLLAFLAMGMAVANTSDLTRSITDELNRIAGLLAVVFFVIHGAEMDLAKLWQAGVVGLAYVLLRSAGKYVGVYWAGRREDPEARRWLGATLLSQAGAAIALSSLAVDRGRELGAGLHDLGLHLQTIILGTVVVFEIVGPLLVRQAVIHAGEVPLAHAIRHTTTTPMEELRRLRDRVLVALGRDPWTKHAPEELTVGHLMRKGARGVPASATFDELIDIIEHSHDNTLPVVGGDNELLGIIRYPELRDVLFDPDVNELVRAVDLSISSRDVLHPDDSISRAWEVFRAAGDDCVPVVTRDVPQQLLGVVHRKDVLRLLVRTGGEGQGGGRANG